MTNHSKDWNNSVEMDIHFFQGHHSCQPVTIKIGTKSMKKLDFGKKLKKFKAKGFKMVKSTKFGDKIALFSI